MLLCHHANVDWCFHAIGWILFECKSGPCFHCFICGHVASKIAFASVHILVNIVTSLLISCELLLWTGVMNLQPAYVLTLCTEMMNRIIPYWSAIKPNYVICLSFSVIAKFFNIILPVFIVRILLLLIRIITEFKKRKGITGITGSAKPRRRGSGQ